MFELYIKINNQQYPASVTLSTKADLEELSTWKTKYGLNADKETLDVLEYSDNSLHKLEQYSSYDRCPELWDDFIERASLSDVEEVAGVFVLKCDILPNELLGFAFVRSSWDKSLILDYLGTRPDDEQMQFAGVGIGMFHTVCRIADSYGAPGLWWETTDLSVGFYLYILQNERLKEEIFLYLSQEEYRIFIERRKSLSIKP